MKYHYSLLTEIMQKQIKVSYKIIWRMLWVSKVLGQVRTPEFRFPAPMQEWGSTKHICNSGAVRTGGYPLEISSLSGNLN